ERDGIHACRGDNVSGEDVGKVRSRHDGSGGGGGATLPGIEFGCDCVGADRTRKRRSRRKVAQTFLGTGDRDGIRGSSIANAASLVRSKEEGAVALDRAAKGAAELVLVKSRLGDVEVALRVQGIVSEEFVDIAVKVVGAGLGDNVYNSAGIAAVFRVEGVG